MYYVGVVESRDDPLMIGRCRVRVFGVHTDDKTELPTADLPWAMAVTPIYSASTSGIGQSPTGIVHGAWVIGFFLDGEDKQQFMMTGTLTSIQAQHLISSGAVAGSSGAATSTTTPTSSSTQKANAPIAAGDAAVNQTPVTNSVTGSVDPTTVRQPSGWTLGQTSKRFESGNNGPGTINDYLGKAAGDPGGASYGTYQLASYLPSTMQGGKARQSPRGSKLSMFLGYTRFAKQFSGIQPATPQFDQVWKSIASSNNSDFQDDQHTFVKSQFYDIMIGNLKRLGLDLTPFGAGVQDLVWSTAVQLGPGRTSVFTTPLKGITRLDDVTIINSVMDYKISNVNTLFSKSSASIRASVANRYKQEKTLLLSLASQYNSAAQIASTPAEKVSVIQPKPPTPIPANPLIPNAIAQAFATNAPAVASFSPKTDSDNQALISQTQLGFNDPDGVYPTSDYDNEPDTNKLARGVSDGTAAEDKSLNRATGMRNVNGDTFDQPINPYNAQYPYNKVMQTESGHVVEYDDTPGSERINIYHTSGTFTEIDANGNMTRRVVGSDYQITDGNGYVRVEGRCNLSVGGSANIVVGADATIEVDGDAQITVGNDVICEAGGRMSLSAVEAIDLRSANIYIEADEELHITAGAKMNVTSQGPINQTSTTGTYIDSGVNLEITVGADFKMNAGGDIDAESQGSMNLKADADFKAFGSSSANLKSSGVTALDGSSMNIQNGASIEADGASPTVPEVAELSEAGLLDGPLDYDEELIDDEFPILISDRVALTVETPEEAANGGTNVIHDALVSSGTATSAELTSVPVTQSAPETNYVLPTIAKTPIISKSDSAQITYLKSLTNVPASYKLTPNFTLGDLSLNARVQRDRVRAQCNLSEGELVANLYELAANVLEPIKQVYPNMFVTSAFRDFSHNTVKSVSQHCLGMAADMQFTGLSKSGYYDLAGQLKNLLPSYDQLLLEFKSYGTGMPWIHISFNSKGNRGQVLTMYNNKVNGSGLIQLAGN